MKEFLKYFIPAFMLFTGIGFVSGWGARDETAATSIYSNIKIDRHKNEYFLTVICGNHYTFRYSVDSNSGRFNKDENSISTAIKYHQTSLNKPSERHMEYVALMGALLGSVAVNVRSKLTDLIAESKKKPDFWTWKNIKNNIYSVIGMITGYAIGYHIASNYDTTCDSGIALELLNDQDMWAKFKTKYMLATTALIQVREDVAVYNLSSNVNQVKKDPIVLCETSLSADVDKLKNAVFEGEPTLDSEYFARLVSYNDRKQKAVSSEIYRELPRLNYGRLIAQNADRMNKGKDEKGAENKVQPLLDRLDYSKEKWQQHCRELEKLTAAKNT